MFGEDCVCCVVGEYLFCLCCGCDEFDGGDWDLFVLVYGFCEWYLVVGEYVDVLVCDEVVVGYVD